LKAIGRQVGEKSDFDAVFYAALIALIPEGGRVGEKMMDF
jgi:hypothetical protein